MLESKDTCAGTLVQLDTSQPKSSKQREKHKKHQVLYQPVSPPQKGKKGTTGGSRPRLGHPTAHAQSHRSIRGAEMAARPASWRRRRAWATPKGDPPGIRMHHTPIERCNLYMVVSNFLLVLKKQHVSTGCKMEIF